MTTSTPRWQDLLQRLMQADHLNVEDSEVEPYQAQPALGFDLGTAWNDAMLPFVLLAADKPTVSARYPASWEGARHVLLNAPFPCCVGMAPQFFQNIHSLMNDAEGFFQQPLPAVKSEYSPEMTLENKSIVSRLAVARLAGDSELAHQLIEQLDGEVLQKNELASQLWLEGQRDDARILWEDLPGESPVIAFNQGLAALASGETQRGQQCMAQAALGFAESTGWHHLAELYRVVTERE